MPIDLTGIITASMPAIIGLIQSRHREADPSAPPLTDAEVKATLKAVVESSLAKDDEIEADVKRRNPPTLNP
jgi:hypothetical protein